MQKRTLKTLLLSLSAVIPTAILPFSLISCGKKPDIQQFSIIFNAGEGHFESTGTNTLTIKVNKGDKFGDLDIEEPVSDAHSFKAWSVNGTEIDDGYVFNEEVQVDAVYEDHIHKVDGYVIDEQEHMIYGYCNTCHSQFELNEEQFNKLEGAIFVKQAGKYELSTKSLDEVVADAYGSEVDIYIVNGTYEISTWTLDQHTVTVNMHGILDYDGEEQLAIFRCVDSTSSGHEHQFLYQWHGMTLNVDNIQLLGLEQNSPSGTGNWQDYGIQPTELNATNCYLKGCHTTHEIGKATFTNCIFDSRGFKDRNGDEIAEYGLYTWNGNVDLYNCTFKTNGKALKIYTDAGIMQADQYFVVNGCTFTKDAALSNKAAVEIDSTDITKKGKPYYYYITLTNSEWTDYFSNLYADKGTRSEFIGDPS